MKPEILKEIIKDQEKVSSMIGRTMRLPTDLDTEINDFCSKHGLNRSALYRRLIAAGWEVVSAD